MTTNNEPLGRDERVESVEAVESQSVDTEPLAPESTDSAPESTESAPAKKSGGNLVLRLTLSLLAITSAVALMLAGVNAVTKEPISDYAAEKRASAMAEVLPEAPWLDFGTVEITVGSSKSGAAVTPMVDLARSYHSPSGLPHALCVETYPSGYGGAISLMTGITIGETEEGTTLTVSAVRIVSHSETSGVGSKTTDPAFLSQYEGKSAGITIGSGDNSIDAISGATISSKAVTAGVNEALEAAESYVAKVLSGEIEGAFTETDAPETESNTETEGGEDA